jgi:two-component system, LytTR family, response regulator
MDILKGSQENVLFFESQKSLTLVQKNDGKTDLLFMPIHKLELMLPQSVFVRIHRCFIINILLVSKFNFNENLVAELEEFKIPVAKRRKSILYEKLLIINSCKHDKNYT